MLAAYLDDPGLPDADRERMQAWGEVASLFVPLVAKDTVIGCLQLIEKRHRRVFSARDRELAATLAALAAVAIENARLHASLEELAITDGLTGVYNHRHFYERLAQEVVRAERYRLPLSLLMMGVDGFKPFNDHHGHPAGDELLRRLAALLLDETRRQVDLVARYGGDEFAVLLPNTNGGGAQQAAKRLHQACTAGDLAASTGGDVPAANADPVPGDPDAACTVAERVRCRIAGASFALEETPPVVTVSIGVASLPDQAPSVAGLVEAADQALYRAKGRGRNRVELAPGSSSA